MNSSTKPKTVRYGDSSLSQVLKDSIYVDKTQRVYDLITHGNYILLSRPRRFGKSLLVDTLEQIFSSNKELFKNLDIYKTDYEWEHYPVIHLDFTLVSNFSTVEDIKNYFLTSLKNSLNKIKISDFKFNIDTYKNPTDAFVELINALQKHTKKNVVILIDEYDKPILDNLDNKDFIDIILKELTAFYSVLKFQSKSIRFLFLTGVGKFSFTSLFSGLNMIEDVSFNSKFSDLCGFTQKEVIDNYSSQIKEVSSSLNLNESETLDNIKLWYDGYLFADKGVSVYNPSSLILFFTNKTFKSYWVSTGTPSFLIKYLSNKEFDIKQMLKRSYDIEKPLNINNLNIISILYQTGYLTIDLKDYSEYSLKFPNKEVFLGYFKELINLITSDKVDSSEVAKDIRNSLNTIDISTFEKEIIIFFSKLNFRVSLDKEAMFQNMLVSLLYGIEGIEVREEVSTKYGVVDVFIETSSNIYIVECKMDLSSKKAVEQILEKKYYQEFLLSPQNKDKKILLMGLNFSSSTKQLEECLVTDTEGNNLYYNNNNNKIG